MFGILFEKQNNLYHRVLPGGAMQGVENIQPLRRCYIKPITSSRRLSRFISENVFENCIVFDCEL